MPHNAKLNNKIIMSLCWKLWTQVMPHLCEAHHIARKMT